MIELFIKGMLASSSVLMLHHIYYMFNEKGIKDVLLVFCCINLICCLLLCVLKFDLIY